MKTSQILLSTSTALLLTLSGCGNATDPITTTSSTTETNTTLADQQCTSISVEETKTILESFVATLGNSCQFISEENAVGTVSQTDILTTRSVEEFQNFLQLSGGFDGTIFTSDGDTFLSIYGSTLHEGITYSYQNEEANGSYLISFDDLNLTVDANYTIYLSGTSFGLTNQLLNQQILLKAFSFTGAESIDDYYDFSVEGRFYTTDNCFIHMTSQPSINDETMRYYNQDVHFEAADGSGFIGREDINSNDILIDHKDTNGTLTSIGTLRCDYSIFGFGLIL